MGRTAQVVAAAHEWLLQHPGAQGVELKPSPAASSTQTAEWEVTHGVLMPDDLREFYALHDGLQLRWNVVAHGREVVPLGCIAINSLALLKPVPERSLHNERDELRPELTAGGGSTVRAFELDATCEAGRVLLVFGLDLGGRKAQVWFQDGSSELSRLAGSFGEYFRLLVLHLGLPRWQYAYSDAGLDPTCRQWLRLMAPDRLVVATSKTKPGSAADDEPLGWGAGFCARDTQPVRTAWVEPGPPSHDDTLRLLSIGALQQQQHGSAHSVTRPSSAAGAPRSAVALLSSGGGGSCSRASSSTSTASSSSVVAATTTTSSPHGVRSSGGRARPTGARPTGGAPSLGARVGSASRSGRARPPRDNDGPAGDE